MFCQLLYRSLSTYARGHVSDLDILREANACNAKLGVTGYLLRSHDGFVQVLEGPEAAVTRIYDTISRDRRHHDITLIGSRHLVSRSFPDWSMGYGDLPEGRQLGENYDAMIQTIAAIAYPDKAG